MTKYSTAFQTRFPKPCAPPHLNSDLEIVRVRNGTLHTTYNGVSIDLLPNDLLIILPYQIHSFSPSADVDAVIYMFSSEIYDKWFGEQELNGIHPPVQSNTALNTYIDSILPSAQAQNNTLCIFSLFYALVNICCKKGQTTVQHPVNSTDNRAIQFILEHLNEDLTIDKIAKYVGLSQRHLSVSFRKKYGVTLTKLINNIRAEKAATLLRLTDQNISLIASNCGFGSLRNFNRSFLRSFQLSPSKYRQLYKH